MNVLLPGVGLALGLAVVSTLQFEFTWGVWRDCVGCYLSLHGFVLNRRLWF